MSLVRWCPLVLFSVLAVCVSVPAQGAEVEWQKSYSEAVRLAKRTRKPLLVEFYAEWCSPCKTMAATTLKDTSVVKLSRQFVSVRVDVDKDPELAGRFKVERIPFTMVLDNGGKLVRASRGFMDVSRFCLFLKQSLPEAP